ncbi:MAG TPA: TRAM domain-containing protein [Longimicrobiales bacterium]|nr:TRAM domain-containing protein [Longimicrobiales bacterium]
MVQIGGIAAGGAGVGRLPDGRAVFVQRTAPGEDVEVRVVEEKRRWARAELVRVLSPAPDRRAAPCPYYARCGGCTLEHLAYPAQLRAKAGIVADALRRIGGIPVEPPEVVASPRELRYRNRVSFTLLRLGRGRVVAGFHEIDHPERVVDIGAACLLPEEPIAETWGRLREAWGPGAERLPAGRRLRLTLRGSTAGEVALVVEGGDSAGRPEELLAAVPGLSAIWHLRPDRELVRLAGRASLEDEWREEDVDVSGAVFLQVNRAAAELLDEHVARTAGDVAGRRVVDAYCGVGLHARRLARGGAAVVGIELDRAAVEEARRTAPPGATFVAGRVEEELPRALPAELVILNPPRGGLDPAVPVALAADPPARLIYVSCDPATLARDLARLAGSFGVESVRCFDLFPQTAHVETVVALRRAS